MENEPQVNQQPPANLSSQEPNIPTRLDGESLEHIAAIYEQRRTEMGVPEHIGKHVESAAERIIARSPNTKEELAERERRDNEERRQSVMRERGGRWEVFIQLRGRRYAECKLHTFACDTEAQTKVVELLTDYCKHMGERVEAGVNVLLLGPPGTGKDHLAVALCRAAIFGGLRVTWRNGQDLWGEFRDAISEESNEAEIVRRFTNCDVLVLSDPLPPRGALTDFQSATLFRIIDGRYSQLRPTWITLNVSNRAEAGERIGHQTIDRLTHGSLIVGCNWPSYRKA